MMDQMMDGFRKASEAAFQAQQEMLRQWSKQMPMSGMGNLGESTEWMQTFQKRWVEFAVETLHKQRESLDSMYKAAAQAAEGSLHLTTAKSPDEYRRAAEELARKNMDTFKALSESQARSWQQTAEKWMELMSKSKA